MEATEELHREIASLAVDLHLRAGQAIAFDPAGDTPRAYGIKAMPSSFLIGTDGRVLYAHAGFRDADKADLEQRIRAALARA